MTARTTAAVLVGVLTASVGMFAAGAASASSVVSTGALSACRAVPADLRLIVASPSDGVAAVSSSGEEPIQMELPAPPAIAARDPEGTTWVQVASAYGDSGELGFGQVLTVAPGGATSVVLDSVNGRLFDVGWEGGRAAALLVDYDFTVDEMDEWGDAYLARADGELLRFSPAGAPEYGIAALSLGNDTIAEGAWVDLTEAFVFYDKTGAAREGVFNPTHGAAYNDVPLWLWPSLSDPSGSADPLLLTWVEGPDYPSESPEPVGGWTVALADALSGTTFHRVDLPLSATLGLHQASFDGRFWVGSFSSSTTPGVIDSLTSYAIDFAAAAPAPVDLQCSSDAVATIDRLNAPQPAPVLPTGRTSAPSSGGCDGVYGDAGSGELPVRRCTRGLPVEVVQTLLVRAGSEVDPDGYFGPGTTATVLQFQRDHGLADDALVGPRTWAELLAAADVDPSDLSLDSNGNGRLDPGDSHLLSAAAAG